MEWIAAGLFFVGLSVLASARHVASVLDKPPTATPQAPSAVRAPVSSPDRRGPVVAPQRVVR
jgi:hypothetical protein